MSESKKNLFPAHLEQNPAPSVGKGTQERMAKVSAQVEAIMGVFTSLLPSNYVSQTKGPYYTLQFQAAAEQIANLQVDAQEAFSDSLFEYTRSEFLYQVMGSLIFPDATSDGYPELPGDLSYRTFLRRMVELLLQGATLENIEGGLALLTDSVVEVIERSVQARKMGGLSGWGGQDLYTFEINVSHVRDPAFPDTGFIDLEPEVPDGPEDEPVETEDTAVLERFPLDPFRLQENVRLVMRALKPAHTLYDYRHLFRETFGDLFTESMTWQMQTYFYEDLRKFCLGAERLAGTAGQTLTDRGLFTDTSRDFSSVSPGAELWVQSGPNSTAASTSDSGAFGRYRVLQVLTFPVGDDSTPRGYTTSGALSGECTVSGDTLEDALQDFSGVSEGETLSILTGPNAGTYRLKVLLGPGGGLIGHVAPPATTITKVRVAPCLLRLRERMPNVATGQSYQVGVDRMGVLVPRQVIDEEATVFFIQ